MQIDKENGGICFNEENHVYFEEKNPECKYISVTTLIHSFSQPFDSGFWSAYKALEKLLPADAWKMEKRSLQNLKRFDKSLLDTYGISEDEFNAVQQGILDAWDEENRKSCERGTAIHLDLENSFYAGGNNVSLQKFGIGGKFVCKKDYKDLDLDYGVYPEYLISKKSKDGILRLAGQVDLIVKSKDDIVIIDHKGLPLNTVIPTESGYKTMGDIVIGDKVFDKDGKLCIVTEKSSIHLKNPCYKITFDNGECIVADFEHRWFVTINGEEKVLTTEEISKEKSPVLIPVVKPLDLQEGEYKVDPYTFGSWYYYNGAKLDRSFLEEYDLINNKRIPELYLRGSYEQRLALLKGIMGKQCAPLYTESVQFLNDMIALLGTLGAKPVVGEHKSGWLLDFSFSESYRTIVCCEPCKVVPTQCIAVDSPSHTYCFGYSFIPTHNTNKEIKKKGGFSSITRQEQKMRYPLNNLPDCNFYHYSLQLSTYAWMLQQINPKFNIKDLILNHYDHKGNNTLYHCDYLKSDVERMLAYYKKQLLRQQQAERRKPIEY